MPIYDTTGILQIMPSRVYGHAIWTNHALKRLSDRGLTQKLAWTTFQYPDRSLPRADGSTIYQKRHQSSVVTVVAKQNDTRQWVIISCWIDPPIAGSADDFKRRRYLKYRQSNLWNKFLMQLGKFFWGLDF